jgi:hypothetical protein
MPGEHKWMFESHGVVLDVVTAGAHELSRDKQVAKACQVSMIV